MYDVGALKPLEQDVDKRLKLEKTAEQYLLEILDERAPPLRRRQPRQHGLRLWQRRPMSVFERRRVIELAFG